MTTITSKQTNQMETMKFYLRPIKQAVIQKKTSILHSDSEAVEEEESPTLLLEG